MQNGVLITETAHGFVCANGGVDASNVGPDSGDVVTLLPRDPDASADRIRAALRARFGTDVAVIVSDSFGRPWRWGIVDVALGVSGLLPLDDLRGQPDADGRVMRTTVRAVADEIASAAELALGKTAGRPVALVRGARPHAGRGPDRRAADARRRTTSSAERDSRYARAMKTGLQISSFTWPGGTDAIGPTLGRIVHDADEAGFDSIWVMDHFFQIRSVGRAEEPMLEGMTALGFMAAHSSRARIGLMVGGVHYRQAPLWVKATTTLDVLSGGRAWLGIGAAWNQQESNGLGFPFPPLGERFEMLEDTLRYAHDMWSGERGTEAAFEGRHVSAVHLLNSPQSISRPRPPIMIGGGGEQKTLRLVAQYADATQRLRRPRDDPPQVRGPAPPLRGDRARPRRDRALDAAVGADRGRRRRRRERAAGHRPLRRARRRRLPARDLRGPRRLGPADDRGAAPGRAPGGREALGGLAASAGDARRPRRVARARRRRPASASAMPMIASVVGAADAVEQDAGRERPDRRQPDRHRARRRADPARASRRATAASAS